MESEEETKCRLCWDTSNTAENPLMHVCQCRGGVEFIHYKCL